LELALMKAVFFTVSVDSPNWLDMVAYISYKLVGMILSLCLRVFLPFLFWPSVVIFSASAGYAMARTLKCATAPTIEMPHVRNSSGKAVVFMGLLQVMSAWYLLK
jgi:hypothetical protein